MSRAARRLLLFVFAFLQCLAPLLHAHTSAEAPSGVHLPHWTQPLAGHHGHDGVWQDASGTHVEPMVIDAARGLGVLAGAEFEPIFSAVGDLPRIDAQGLKDPPAPSPAFSLPDPSWLHPALRAPPRA